MQYVLHILWSVEGRVLLLCQLMVHLLVTLILAKLLFCLIQFFPSRLWTQTNPNINTHEHTHTQPQTQTHEREREREGKGDGEGERTSIFFTSMVETTNTCEAIASIHKLYV